MLRWSFSGVLKSFGVSVSDAYPQTLALIMTEYTTLYLQRQWELLEGHKKLRLRIPTVCCTLSLAVTGFYLNSAAGSKAANASVYFLVFEIILWVFGVWTLTLIRGQYNFSNEVIDMTYKKIGLDSFISEISENRDVQKNKSPGIPSENQDCRYSDGKNLFLIGYVSMSLFCAVSIFTLCVT